MAAAERGRGSRRIGRPNDLEKYARVKELYESGMSTPAIGVELGMTRQNVYRMLQRIEQGLVESAPPLAPAPAPAPADDATGCSDADADVAEDKE